ncbi:hypothetical protein IC229_28945 [Spirosoma sp. BT702]|uniref:Uncharacterized protein n=1 Tax=Spirosoma profusum TaxID=2771354 RepID=A0A927AUL7_9BACT|nr:hypothetical protein [Spirosoma profusum]MBD2704698.1 hypothetical protein [Spirosoma profusum]
MRDGHPTRPDDSSTAGEAEVYSATGYPRNLCLGWPDGRRFFLNYAYLLAGEFEPNSEKNVIRLHFTSHSIFLLGYSLETLFMALLEHIPRLIVAMDPRYVLDEDKADTIVVEIMVEKKEE